MDLDLDGFNFPASPVWNIQPNAVGTPGGGFLYLVGQQTAIKYIAPICVDKIKDIPTMKPKKCITQIACDPDWSKHKYFATLDVDDIVNIWDLDEGLIIKGHRGHTLGVGRTRFQSLSNRLDPIGGALCYLESNVVLSNIENLFLRFSVASNQFTTITVNYMFKQNAIVVMKVSPYDPNIVACGTSRGLVTVINLDQKSIVHSFSAHNNTITSLEWQQLTICASSEPRLVCVDTEKSASKSKPERPKAVAHSKEVRLRGPPKPVVADDDIFNIYEFDDCADKFGVTSKPTYATSSAVEETKPETPLSNENFNFVEACQTLKEDNLQTVPAMDDSLIASDFEKLSMSGTELTASVEDPNPAAHSSKKSIKKPHQVADLDESLDHSSDESFVHVVGEKVVAKKVTFLASASISKEAIIWLWNVDTGSSAHKITLKKPVKNQTNERHIHILWTNEKSIIANTPNGDLVEYQLIINDGGKITTKIKDVQFTDRGVSGLFLCPPEAGSPPIIWTKSTSNQLQSTLLSEPPRMLRLYSTIPMAMYIICECPHDPNKIAFAGAGRRIQLLNLSNLTTNRVPLTYFANGVQSKIYYLSWHPVHENVLAFGTEEGRIGIYDLNKPSNFPALVKPFHSKSIYQLCWAKISNGPDDLEPRYVLLTCSDGDLRYIPDSGLNKHTAIHLPMDKRITAVNSNEQYIGLGTKDGHIMVYKPYIVGQALTKIILTTQICTKYISECAWNPVNPSKVAFSSFERGIRIFDLELENPTEVEILLNSPPGTTHIKWSAQTEHLLVSCSYGGSVCVWDTNSKSCLVTYQLSNSAYSAMFMPTDENYVMCTGRRDTLVIFDIRSEASAKKAVKSEKVFSDSHCWATLLQNDTQQLMVTEKKNNRKAQRKIAQQSAALVQPPSQLLDGEESDVGIIYECDSPLTQSVTESIGCPYVDKSTASQNNGLQFQYTTICYLSSKEFNKDALNVLLMSVEDTRNYASTMHCRLFKSKADIRGLLAEELKNHKLSRTDSVAHVLIPSLLCDLQAEIQAKAIDGRLTESDLAIAPKVSYNFWKECCQKYFLQMLRNGFPLLALPYIQTHSEVHNAIEVLCNKHYFREAWILARLNMDGSDSIFVDILEKWISWLEANGNLDGAALIASSTGQIPRALGLLSKRRNKPEEVLRIINYLQTQVPIPFVSAP